MKPKAHLQKLYEANIQGKNNLTIKLHRIQAQIDDLEKRQTKLIESLTREGYQIVDGKVVEVITE
jgi:DNA-binding winged helix-turn-helix (wHTH) protein